MFRISKIIFDNYKIFRHIEIDLNEKINIFVGDNGSGKSSILQGIELALSGSTTKIQNIGLESLINIDAVNECLVRRDIKFLPKLIIEVYLVNDSEASPKDEIYFGEKNKSRKEAFGVALICEPREEYMPDIAACITSDNPVFPYELYRIYHLTFKGERFNQYKKPLKTIFVNGAEINFKYALLNTIKDTYVSSVTEYERAQNRQNYRNLIGQYKFAGLAQQEGICISSNLEDNLSIEQGGVHIENLGQGEINIIKISYAIKHANDDTSVVFLEEPENHLTHCRMRKILGEITKKSDYQQVFVATHSSQIVTRLGLSHVFFISKGVPPVSLKNIDINTSDFFKKAPNDNLLQFILSKKVILVEGAAEYILMDYFYTQETGNSPERDDVWIISVNNLSFKRYLKIAGLIHNRVAVITDNDRSSIPKYVEYRGNEIQVFSDIDPNRYTFEKCIYDDNKQFCELIFGKEDTLNWMLNNKAESAYQILQKIGTGLFRAPDYIKQAVLWIRK